VYVVAAGAAALGVSVWLGYRYGVRCRDLPAYRYWIANAVGVFAGLVLAAIAALLRLTWLWVAATSVMAGSVWGLKYGLGRIVGRATVR
jgi:hypothetical protein